YLADGLHGDLTQKQRDRVMNKFRKGIIDVLVATDVAARGIDVEDIEIVFNYDVPNDDEYYVHRIGRTGRAGKKGKAFTFVSGKEIYQLRDIQRYTKTKIEQQEIPSLHRVQEIKTDQFIKKVKNIINTEDLEKQIHIVERLIEEDYTSVEMAAALLKMAMTKEDINNESADDFGNTGASPGMVRFFINIGRKDRVRAKDIVRAVADKTGLSSSVIGKVDIYDKFSFMEIPSTSARDVFNTMNGVKIRGRSVNIETANKKMK
ncbi:MAG: DbpA RNA binding domain-containing protein, partial [Methanobacterium sp.]|nr:DbpA RNA binding domain-containing protein [Methanobacterium sp.]